jgi:mevalonate kinase
VEVTTVLPGGGRSAARWAADVDTLAAAARAGGFFSYAAGVAAEVLARHDVGGIGIDVTEADLPVGKGLSSSAALCVLVARAYGRVHGLGLDTRDEMALAYAGERLAGSACGSMDQVCAFGRRTLLLTFDGPDVAIEPLAPGAVFHFLVVDLRRAKDTRRILDDLNACFPDTPGSLAAGVRDALGPRNAALVAAARSAVVEGDGPRLGSIMRAAQAVFDDLVAPACPELAAPRLHEVLAHPAIGALAWGGKGVGSQGDGSAQILARGAQQRDRLARRLAADLGVACLPLTLRPDEGPLTSCGSPPASR